MRKYIFTLVLDNQCSGAGVGAGAAGAGPFWSEPKGAGAEKNVVGSGSDKEIEID